MSKRERWIVYPLLFFALGSALRDKILQRIEAKEVFCESLKIVDQQDPSKLLAELTFQRAMSNDPTQPADRVGLLRLIDSDGREVCNLSNDLLAERLITGKLLVIDPVNRRPLVIAGTELVPDMLTRDSQPTASYQGVIYLNNRRLGIRLAPPASRPTTPAHKQPAKSPEQGG